MKEFIAELSKRYNVKRKDLLEKDIIIQKILFDLSKHDFFLKNFAFKGGTCLIKCYLGYYRFSEDIDLTWRDQTIFTDISQKEIRKIISEFKDKIGDILIIISKNRGLDFKMEKDDKNFVEFGGGNKFVTFKIWYNSEILNERSFIKIQINFVERIVFDVSKKDLGCIVSGEKSKELKLLYGGDYSEYVKNISLYTYDVKEILCEKVRAILTRRGLKARDFLDVLFITKKYGFSVTNFKDEIIKKTDYMLNMYKKYISNFNDKKEILKKGNYFKWGYEKDLLLVEIDDNEFNTFLKEFTIILQDICKNIH
jgi:predicted nucleotidyltransferase component of viral defense system